MTAVPPTGRVIPRAAEIVGPARPPGAARPALDYEALAQRRLRTMVTPEGVDLRLAISEASDRFAAFLIDSLLIAFVFTAISFGAFYAAAATGQQGAFEFVGSAWMLVGFFLRYFWFVAFEIRPKAATPGKRMLRLRVAARDGGRLTAEAVFVRNAMREVEVYLPLTALLAGAFSDEPWSALAAICWTGVFLLFPLFNKDRLRVGDLIAGTWVVKAPRRKLLTDLADREAAVRAHFTFTPEQTAAYGERELIVLEEVLRGKDVKVRADVAVRIRRKIGWSRQQGETDAAFLDAYYAALRRRLEGGMLIGRRKKDKFDTTVGP